MRISDWSSDVCSSDLIVGLALDLARPPKEKWPQSWSILPCRKSPSGFGNFNRTDRANMIPKPSEMSIPCITDADMIVDQYRYLLLFRSSRLIGHVVQNFRRWDSDDRIGPDLFAVQQPQGDGRSEERRVGKE